MVLLQCLWRCYAAEARSHCFATWRIHVQDSSLGAGAGHHHHSNAHLLSRLGWRSAPRKSGGVGRRAARFTLLDGTAVAVALMCQTAEVSGQAAATTARNATTRDDGE